MDTEPSAQAMLASDLHSAKELHRLKQQVLTTMVQGFYCQQLDAELFVG